MASCNTATATNGKPRKQLSDQLDRLDGIIDALADGLNQAVADACREGTRLAVRDVLLEIASNPELRAMLAPQSSVTTSKTPDVSAEAPKAPGLWSRIKSKVAERKKATAGAVTRAKEAVIRRCAIAGEAVVALGRMTGEVLPLRKIVLVGLGVGLLVGVASLIVPQTAAAVASGVGAACTSIAVQTGNWLTRAARRVGLLS